MIANLRTFMLVTVALLVPAFGMSAEEVDTERGYARIRAYTSGLHSMTAQFRQQMIDAGGELVQEGRGTLSIQRPNRFRWQYTEPYEQLILGDGEKLWSYDADLEQAVVRGYDDVLAASPAMLLSGARDVAELYEVAALRIEDGLDWVVLAPRALETDFKLLGLGFADGELRRMDLIDSLDQLTRIELTGVERNPALEESAFEFSPPPGVDVIEATDR